MQERIKEFTMYYWISGALFLIWFFAFMFFDAEKEVHFVFLASVLVLVSKIVMEYRNEE